VAQFDPTRPAQRDLAGQGSIRIKPGAFIWLKTIESVNMPEKFDGEYYSPGQRHIDRGSL